MWVKPARDQTSSSRQVLMALAGASKVGTDTGTQGRGGRGIYTVADAEMAMVLEQGRLVVWIKGVRYDAARAARGPWFEGRGRDLSVGQEGGGGHGRGGAESAWREVLAQDKWSLLVVTMQASADFGPAAYPHAAAASAATPTNPLPPPAGAVVGSHGRVIGAEARQRVDVPPSAAGAREQGAGNSGTSGREDRDGRGRGRGGLKMSMYVDGKALLEFAPVPEIDEDAAPLMFGGCNCTKSSADAQEPPSAHADAAFEAFDGWMDSIRVWSRALSSEDVAKMARAGPADAAALSPHLELPFPVQAIDVPSAPEGIHAVRVWDPGRLVVQMTVPTDSGDGLCVLGRKPTCCSASNSSMICAKCRQGRPLPCPLITRYRLELDDSPTFSDLDFVREYDVPGVSRSITYPGQGGKSQVRGEAELIAGGPEDADYLGGGLGDMKNRTLYRLEAPNLPLGSWLFVRVFAEISIRNLFFAIVRKSKTLL